MRTEAEIAATNKQLDEVLSHGTEFAIGWLRGAFHTHKDQMQYVLAKHLELRALYLANVARPLTVRESQLLDVCRICRVKASPTAQSELVLNFGEEFAHKDCLDSEFFRTGKDIRPGLVK